MPYCSTTNCTKCKEIQTIENISIWKPKTKVIVGSPAYFDKFAQIANKTNTGTTYVTNW